jgi:hypothetical protein
VILEKMNIDKLDDQMALLERKGYAQSASLVRYAVERLFS